jgi:hypothetical protein
MGSIYKGFGPLHDALFLFLISNWLWEGKEEIQISDFLIKRGFHSIELPLGLIHDALCILYNFLFQLFVPSF